MPARRFLAAVVTLVTAACGGASSSTTSPPPPPPPSSPPPPPPGSPTIVIISGDGQVANNGTTLYQLLKVGVSQSGAPLSGQTVLWQTSNGSVTPTQSTTAGDGTATTSWTLGTALGSQTARAYVGSTSGASVTFNALGAVTPSGSTVEVDLYYSGGPRFEPAAIIIPAGTTVNWVWKDGTHSVLADGSPAFTSSVTYDAPRSYQFTFTAAGTYRYHCGEHGSAGSGMNGVVIVQ